MEVCGGPTAVLDQIGWTPLIELHSVSRRIGCTVLGKMEHANPGGSVKDRIARYIVDAAERRGELEPGSTILEVTSGNTGIALSMVGAARGYRVVIRMPASVSVERRQMLRAFGAEVELLDDLLRMHEAVEKAEEEASDDPSIFLPRQFSNPDNVRAHELGTGPEILRQTDGELDAFVMGVGTGGTVMGVGRAFRSAGHRARIVAVEPAESAVLSGGSPGRHGIQGLADGFIPEIVEPAELDQIVTVSTDEAVDAARRLHRDEGLLVGISSGANIAACRTLARELEPGATIVTVLPDRGERYLSLWDGG
ncbi:MAG: cysteine synthase A [Thermoanaerobaculia bacterium]|nr:cysteine synthase A [Thermoanaerobaculia bacterium]